MAQHETREHPDETGVSAPVLTASIPGWKIGIPVIRLFACGPFTIEVLHEVPGGDAAQARYAPLPPERLHGRGPAPAVTFLKLLTSQPDRYAPKDWLIEHVRQDDYLITPKRLENIVSFVRQLLSLPDGTKPAGMLRYVRASHESGDGYRLAPYPLIWLDVDALAFHVRQACLLERFGDDPLPSWERAYQLASRGTYLSEEPYSEWAEVRREEVEGHLRQCVHALARLWLARYGASAEEEVLHLLRGYWPRHPDDEDVAWGLMDLLGRRGRYQEALDIYARFEQSLAEEGLTKDGQPRTPDQRTRDLADYLRFKERQPMVNRPPQREATAPSPVGTLVQRDGTPAIAVPAMTVTGQEEMLDLFSKAVKQGILQAAGELGNGRRSEAPATQQTGSRQSLESDLPVDRREATKQIGSLLTLFATPDVLSPLQPLLQLADTPKGPGIDEGTFDSFAQLNEICRQLSEGSDLKMAESILWTYLPKVELIARLSSEHQQTAASIAAHGYLLAASLAGHRNNLLERLRLSEQALLYGELANDVNLQVVALRQIAISFDCFRRPDRVLQTYQRALPHLHATSPLLRACIYADISGAHAQLGQQQEAYRFIGMAYDHFPEHPENEPSYLHTICRYASLIFWEGLNHLLLAQPQQAEAIFTKIDGIQSPLPNPERNRAEVLNYQVETFIALGNMEQACRYLEAALQAATTIGSRRRFQETVTLFQQMRTTWPYEQRVQQLADLFMR